MPKGTHTPILQKRDLFLFRVLLKAKITTPRDLVPLVFPSIPTARRRLRKLVSGRYIAGYVPVLHNETRYVIDRLGIKALMHADHKKIPIKPAPRKLEGLGEHHLGLVRFWSKLVLECYQSSEVSLKSFQFEWELAPSHLHTITSVRPDAIFMLAKSNQVHKFSVELDRGTESPRYVATTKFESFARRVAGRRKTESHHMLLLVEEEKRLRALTRALGPLRAPILGRIFSRGNEGNPLLGSSWYRLENLDADLSEIPL